MTRATANCRPPGKWPMNLENEPLTSCGDIGWSICTLSVGNFHHWFPYTVKFIGKNLIFALRIEFDGEPQIPKCPAWDNKPSFLYNSKRKHPTAMNLKKHCVHVACSFRPIYGMPHLTKWPQQQSGVAAPQVAETKFRTKLMKVALKYMKIPLSVSK